MMMNNTKKTFIIYSSIAVSFFGLVFFCNQAFGAEITDAQIEVIRNDCLSTKTTLNQLHVSDALLRVNSGQIYESISTKLMSRFNDRIASNHFGNANFATTTEAYNQILDKFRQDYKTYEESLSSAMSIDCTKQPVYFYDTLAQTRLKRDQVHSDVAELNRYINQYKELFDEFKKDFQNE